jgi:hypothetical protein
LEFPAAGRRRFRCEKFAQGHAEIGAVDSAVGKRFSQAEFDNPAGVVGLVVGTGNDELRCSRYDAFGGGSYPTMMDDGAAAGKNVFKARVRDVKGAGREWSFRGIQAD